MAQNPVHGEQDVNKLLSTLRVHQDSITYVYMTFAGNLPTILDEIPVIMRLDEPKISLSSDAANPETAPTTSTTTIIASLGDAKRHNLAYEYPCRRLTLAVQSSLAAVGFMAVVGKALADEGISVNTVAGYWHDHLFVDVGKAVKAVGVIEGLRAMAVAASSYASGNV